MTLSDLVVADLLGRAAAATSPSERSLSGQIEACWRARANRDFVAGRQVEGDTGVILGALAAFADAHPPLKHDPVLAKARAAAGRLAALGARLRGGQG